MRYSSLDRFNTMSLNETTNTDRNRDSRSSTSLDNKYEVDETKDRKNLRLNSKFNRQSRDLDSELRTNPLFGGHTELLNGVEQQGSMSVDSGTKMMRHQNGHSSYRQGDIDTDLESQELDSLLHRDRMERESEAERQNSGKFASYLEIERGKDTGDGGEQK